jgi:hypothetical protein
LKSKKELERLLEASVRVLQSPNNHKDEDKILKGFIEGLKSALDQVTPTGYMIDQVDSNIQKNMLGLKEKIAAEKKNKSKALKK